MGRAAATAMNTTVLIVDDEPHVSAAIRRLLRPDGYEILAAGDGSAALRILAKQDVAVVICDQRMPGMSGAKVMAESAKRSPDTYRIAVTDYDDLAAVRESINEGRVQHLLLKPWNDEHLREAVREGARRFQLVRENQRLLELTQRQKAQLECSDQELAGKVRLRTVELQVQNQELTRLERWVSESLHDVVGVLSALIEASEPNLALHAKRVAQLASSLGEQLGLDEQTLRDLGFAALLHEIGRAGSEAKARAASKSAAGARRLSRSRPSHPAPGRPRSDATWRLRSLQGPPVSRIPCRT